MIGTSFRELLKFGFRVRASARNVEKAETLFQVCVDSKKLKDFRIFRYDSITSSLHV
jgi:hypothetical protein